MNKAVFFDRDNTLIVDRIYLNDPDDIIYLDGDIDCLKAISEAGYKIIIVTNQSGVPRGLVQLENLEEIHRRIAARYSENGIEISGFYYAPHLPESDHPMRKPNTGMLDAGAKDHNIDLFKSWMVGDRLTDVIAGQRAGCKTVFLLGTEQPDQNHTPPPNGIAKDLKEVAKIILSDSTSQ
jgi:histidinol-phosphate phosphatase family protein